MRGARPRSAAGPGRPAPVSRSRRNLVLLLSADPDWAAVAAALLQKEGRRAAIAMTEDEALMHLLHEPFELVFVDSRRDPGRWGGFLDSNGMPPFYPPCLYQLQESYRLDWRARSETLDEPMLDDLSNLLSVLLETRRRVRLMLPGSPTSS